jgi:Ras family protein T1
MVKYIRALLIGDEKVGKTTLISTLVSDKFPETVPLIVPPAIVPAEINNNVELTIVDTYFRRDQDNDREIINELAAADVVLVVYDSSRGDSAERIRTFWLPLVLNYRSVPIILVGNKSDIKIADSIRL